MRLLATAALEPLARVKARSLARSEPLLLHLGSSHSPKSGWINIDLFGPPVDLAWNLNRRLPFASGSADAIFHEHVLEHLSLRQAIALMDESHRLLRAGGVLRIVVPDARRHVEGYAKGSRSLVQREDEFPTPLLAAQQVFVSHGHQVAYDGETLLMLARISGFANAEVRAYRETALDPPPDSTHRAAESVYLEATRL